jgi:hypothetical protein
LVITGSRCCGDVVTISSLNVEDEVDCALGTPLVIKLGELYGEGSFSHVGSWFLFDYLEF